MKIFVGVVFSLFAVSICGNAFGYETAHQAHTISTEVQKKQETQDILAQTEALTQTISSAISIAISQGKFQTLVNIGSFHEEVVQEQLNILRQLGYDASVVTYTDVLFYIPNKRTGIKISW
jgi:vacuolar-type H+-ATPase subunit F/Vma7